MRLKCTVSYEGSHYCGWQSQKAGDSIQEKIESALQNILQDAVHITASGRTDKGVNAEGQVFHFDTEKEMKETKWKSSMNAFLPDDIHIKKVEKVNDYFHARYNAYAKTYQYCIHMGEYDVFSRNTAYQCPYSLDVSKMKEASRYLIGTHDFTSFNSNTLAQTPDQIRTVYSIDVKQDGEFITIKYTGNGFLRYMVRMMSAQLLEAGRGRIESLDVKRILEERSKNTSRRKAHSEGLTLMQVKYFHVIAREKNCLVRTWTEYDQEVPEGNSFCVECAGKRIGVFFIDQGRIVVSGEENICQAGSLITKLEEYVHGGHVEVSLI